MQRSDASQQSRVATLELWQGRCPPVLRQKTPPAGQRPLKLPSLKNTTLRLKTLRPSQKASNPSDPRLKTPKDLQALAKTLGPSLKNTGKLQAFAKCTYSPRTRTCRPPPGGERPFKDRSIKEGPLPSHFVPHQLRPQQQNLPLEPLLSASRFSHPHLPVALRRLGRAGRGAGEPGPASGVAASGTQRGPGRGGRPPLPRRRLSLPAAPRLRHPKAE